MKKTALAALCLLLFFNSNGVIYRHDRSEAEYRRLGEAPQFNCVGLIVKGLTNEFTILGSCVLISDRYVLTALHVLTEQDIIYDTVKRDGMQMIVFKPVTERVRDVTSCNFNFAGRTYRGKTIKYFPDYFTKETKGQCDIAIVELAEPVTNVSPPKLNVAFNELHSLATGVGFGASGPADKPEEVGSYGANKLAGQNMIDSLEGYLYNGRKAFISFDFDHPNMPQYNLMGDSKPISLEYMIGGGDSGGGMFRQCKDGTWELIGICTGGGTNIDLLIKIGYYGHVGKFTRISVFHDWILTNIKQ